MVVTFNWATRTFGALLLIADDYREVSGCACVAVGDAEKMYVIVFGITGSRTDS